MDFLQVGHLMAGYALDFLEQEGAPLWAFTCTMGEASATGDLEAAITRFTGRNLEEALEQARGSIMPGMPGVQTYAVVWDGYVTTDDRTDAVLVEVGGSGSGSPHAVHFAQPYRVHRRLIRRGSRRFEALGPQVYCGYTPSRLALGEEIPASDSGDETAKGEREAASPDGALMPTAPGYFRAAGLEDWDRLPSSPLPEPGLSYDESDEADLRAEAEAGNIAAMNSLGALLSARGQVDEAMRWFHYAAEDGYPAAMFNIAVQAHLARRTEEALLWYHRAAEAGDDDAMLNLGGLLAGRGDVPGAVRLWEAAAAKGNAAAMRTLSQFAQANGDSRGARKWRRMAAAADPDHPMP